MKDENNMQKIPAKAITPILNVSDMQQSFAWFEKLGWSKGWDWGIPLTFDTSSHT